MNPETATFGSLAQGAIFLDPSQTYPANIFQKTSVSGTVVAVCLSSGSLATSGSYTSSTVVVPLASATINI
jgi:hypothetical protein